MPSGTGPLANNYNLAESKKVHCGFCCTLEPELSLKKVLHRSLETRKRENSKHTRFQVGAQQVHSAADLGQLNKGRLKA